MANASCRVAQTREPEVKLPTSIRLSKKQESSRKRFISALLTTPKPLTGLQQTVENSSRDGNTRPPDLPPGVRTGHGTIDWLHIGKGVCQGCILPPYLFNLYAEYIVQNARLDEAQARIKIAGRNISNLR